MSTRFRGAIAVWRSRDVRTAGDRGYLVYLVFAVALVAVAPVARAVWLSATSADGLALFGSATAPGATVIVAAALWAGGMLIGRDRGPALLPPFLTHALATSDLPRSRAFRGPVLRAGGLVTAVTTIFAGLVAGSLMSHGLADLFNVITFTVTGTMVGVLATVAWLAGQAFPRAAVPVALGLIALSVVPAFAPALRPFTPWGWVGVAYPTNGSFYAVAALFAVTVAAVAAVPVLINRIELGVLTSQAVRWDSMTAHAIGMDLGTAVAVYQARPRLGRDIGAIRAVGGMSGTFLVRDAIGAARTPGRLIVAVLALACAGALITFAFAPGTPGWLLGATAGMVVFAALGPLTDGVRHAASIASDFPLYGISDERLLANHLLFPLATTMLVLLAAALVCSVATGFGPAAPILSSLALGILALAARISNALKGPLPPVLLAPIPTPMGDLGAALRLAWAIDALLLTALVGAAAATVFQSPASLISVSVVLLVIGINRWRHRR